MIDPSGTPLGALLPAAGLALLSGFALGLAYFAALRANVRLYLSGGGGLAPFAFHLARLAGAVVAAVIAVRLGGAPGLLGGLAGFLVARAVAVRPEVHPASRARAGERP